METVQRFRGSLLGLAIGDALGHPTEFLPSVTAIRERYGPSGVRGFEPAGRHAAGTFTDDTQMSMAVARALLRAGHQDLDELMRTLGHELVAWSLSPENDRAPGGTCLEGCRNLARGSSWRTAGVPGSKGCGAAMRAAPIGLFHHADPRQMVRVAAAQSVLTHGHPTAVLSSVAAAAAVAWVAAGNDLEGLLGFTREAVHAVPRSMLLALGAAPELVADVGHREMVAALDRLEAEAATESDDVCRLLGGAWVGEEAVACALWCVLRAEGHFAESVLRGANSSGDSDSIACIAGSITGALGGVAAIPAAWVREVEKAALLDALARALHRAAESGQDDPELEPALDLFGAEKSPGDGC